MQILILFMVAFLFLFLKSPDALLQPQFWAEDGAVFFVQQLGQKYPQIFVPYAGYLHATPRLIAWFASYFHILFAPLIYNIAALCIDAACIAYVTLIASRIFERYVVFLSFFAIPTAGDIFGSVTNVQWFIQFVLVMALFAPKKSNHGKHATNFLGYVLLLIASLSGPFSTLIVAISVGIYLLGCNQYLHIVISRFKALNIIKNSCVLLWSSLRKDNLVVVLMGATIQLFIMLTNEIRTPEGSMALSLEQIKTLGLIWPQHPYVWIVNNWITPLHVFLLLIFTATIILCIIAAQKKPGLYIYMCCFFLVFGAIQPILAFVKQHTFHTLAATSHYFFFLGVISFWIVVSYFVNNFQKVRVPLLGVLFGIIVYSALIKPDYFRRAPLPNLNWKMYAQRIHAGEKNVFVPLSPLPWHFVAHPSNAPNNARNNINERR